MRRRPLRPGLAAVCLLLAAGCAQAPDSPAAAPPSPAEESPPTAAAGPTATPDPTPTATATPTPDPTPTRAPLGTEPPPWLGTRVLPTTSSGYGEIRRTPPALRTRRFTLPDTIAPLPGEGYAARVADPAPARVIARSTWQEGCPVGADELAWVRVTFRGFDGRRHTGELLVNSAVTQDVVQVFRDLWRADFPLEAMAITTDAQLDAPPTGDGNGTGAFVCRPVTGGTSYSEHAYGLAIDLNPFQNPYLRERDGQRIVLPELASAYLDRDRGAPGMIEPGGPVVQAFARVGWEWGGDYQSLKDYQHFSLTGG